MDGAKEPARAFHDVGQPDKVWLKCSSGRRATNSWVGLAAAASREGKGWRRYEVETTPFRMRFQSRTLSSVASDSCVAMLMAR